MWFPGLFGGRRAAPAAARVAGGRSARRNSGRRRVVAGVVDRQVAVVTVRSIDALVDVRKLLFLRH